MKPVEYRARYAASRFAAKHKGVNGAERSSIEIGFFHGFIAGESSAKRQGQKNERENRLRKPAKIKVRHDSR